MKIIRDWWFRTWHNGRNQEEEKAYQIENSKPIMLGRVELIVHFLDLDEEEQVEARAYERKDGYGILGGILYRDSQQVAIYADAFVNEMMKTGYRALDNTHYPPHAILGVEVGQPTFEEA